MATQAYDVFFGTTAAGGTPAFATYVNNDTSGSLTPPSISDIGGGFYRFTVDWGAISATHIRYAMTLAGFADQWDDITSPDAESPVVTITSTGQSQNIALYDSAGTIIQRAGIQLGLGTIADPYASTDPKWIQLCDALRSAGSDLLAESNWTNLQKEVLFTTSGAASAYALPSDYRSMLDQSGWDRSTFMPLVGPVSAQESQYLKARLVNVLFNIVFRIQGGILTFPIVPANGSEVAFAYLSKFWAMSSGSTDPDKARPTVSTDNVLFDPELALASVKLYWARDRGFDTAAFEERYDRLLDSAIGENAGAQILSLDGRRGSLGFDRMINGRNVPDGNWG